MGSAWPGLVHASRAEGRGHNGGVNPPRSPARPVSRTGTAGRAAPPGFVRIIGGTWRRQRLPIPAAPGLRPTPDRVRETLFNWLGQDLTGWRVLDAFAGSGALGFEAASRGAAEVVLLERDAALVRALRSSRERLQAVQVRIEGADALPWMAAAAAGAAANPGPPQAALAPMGEGPPRGPVLFHLILLDPPFGAGLFLPALRAAVPLLLPQGALYLEADRPFSDAELAPLGLQVHRAGHAGKVCFHLLRPAGPGAGE